MFFLKIILSISIILTGYSSLQTFLNAKISPQIASMLTWTLHYEINDEALLDIGNVLEYAAILHITNKYADSLTEEILGNILKLIASDNLLNSLLGHRVLQHMMDRKSNRQQFDPPR